MNDIDTIGKQLDSLFTPQETDDVKETLEDTQFCVACGRIFHVDHYFCWAVHQAVCKYDSEKAKENGTYKEWLEQQLAENKRIMKIKKEREQQNTDE